MSKIDFAFYKYHIKYIQGFTLVLSIALKCKHVLTCTCSIYYEGKRVSVYMGVHTKLKINMNTPFSCNNLTR